MDDHRSDCACDDCLEAQADTNLLHRAAEEAGDYFNERSYPEVCLTQYVVVRRDLPALRKIIDVGHAAGEAFFGFATKCEIPKGFNPDKTTLILKGARNEQKLLKLEKKLQEAGVAHSAIREPDAPWNGQLMAIALVPGTKEEYSKYVTDYQPLKAEEIEPMDGKHDGADCPEGLRGCQNCK